MVKFALKRKQKKYLIFGAFLSIFLSFLFPFFLPLSLHTIPYSFPVFDKNGDEISEVVSETGVKHRKINFTSLPDFTKKAFVTLEDDSFYSNIGIDFGSLFRAGYKNIEAGEIRQGGSTISTQLVKNLYWLNEKRTFWRKILEMYLGIVFNIRYSKDEILGSYLENIYFGYGNYGIESAARFYFGKSPENLTKAEQIAMIVIPKNSNLYNPFKREVDFEKRFTTVVTYLAEKGLLSKEEKEEILKERLLFVGESKTGNHYLGDFFQSKRKNFPQEAEGIQTTIDKNLQQQIEQIAKKSITPLLWKNVGDYAVVLVDKDTMELHALVGGSDYFGSGGQVNAALSPRQVGSTIKPFTYLLAFKNLGYTPETTISDVPTQFLTDKGYAYDPKNYSLKYKGEVTLAEALSQSINIPAVKLAEQIGVRNLLDFLRSVGITTLNHDENYYGLALTLGVGEISLWELTQAYSIFAEDGKYCPIHYLQDENTPFSDCKEIVSSKYTDMVNQILSDRYIKLEEFPLGGNLDFADKKVTLKTGTSRNFKDNWTVGFTDHYLIGVWAGNKDGTEMKGVSGATGAGEIFRNIVDALEPSTGEQTLKNEGRNSLPYLEITSPLDKSNYQINPSKPITSQQIKLKFETNISYDTAEWFVNGESYTKDLYQISEGRKTFKVVIKKDGRVVGEEESRIAVE